MAFMPLGFQIGAQLSAHNPVIIIIFAFITVVALEFIDRDKR